MRRGTTRLRHGVLQPSVIGVALALIGAICLSPHILAASLPCGAISLSGSSWLGGKGVDVHSNGAYQTTGLSCADDNHELYDLKRPIPQYGYGWQCAELANRLYATRGWFDRFWLGSDTNGGVRYMYVYAIVGKYPGVVAKPNGSGYIPIPGDLVVHTNGLYGHISVVDHIDGGTLYAVEQNNSLTGRATYAFNAQTGLISKPGATIAGVLHAARNTTPASVKSAAASALVASVIPPATPKPPIPPAVTADTKPQIRAPATSLSTVPPATTTVPTASASSTQSGNVADFTGSNPATTDNVVSPLSTPATAIVSGQPVKGTQAAAVAQQPAAAPSDTALNTSNISADGHDATVVATPSLIPDKADSATASAQTSAIELVSTTLVATAPSPNQNKRQASVTADSLQSNVATAALPPTLPYQAPQPAAVTPHVAQNLYATRVSPGIPRQPNTLKSTDTPMPSVIFPSVSILSLLVLYQAFLGFRILRKEMLRVKPTSNHSLTHRPAS